MIMTSRIYRKMERQRSFYLPRYLHPMNIGGYEVYAHRSAFYDSVNTNHLRASTLFPIPRQTFIRNCGMTSVAVDHVI